MLQLPQHSMAPSPGSQTTTPNATAAPQVLLMQGFGSAPPTAIPVGSVLLPAATSMQARRSLQPLSSCPLIGSCNAAVPPCACMGQRLRWLKAEPLRFGLAGTAAVRCAAARRHAWGPATPGNPPAGQPADGVAAHAPHSADATPGDECNASGAVRCRAWARVCSGRSEWGFAPWVYQKAQGVRSSYHWLPSYPSYTAVKS